MQVFTDITPEGMPGIASTLMNQHAGVKLWAFHGEMGAGKTTLIREICRLMGVNEEITSPTFSLVNVYHTNRDQTLYHFDFYRIRELSEVYDIGYEDYFYSGNLCLIEWPEKIETLLADEQVVHIRLSRETEHSRTVSVTY